MKEGDIFTVDYPFVKEAVTLFDGEGHTETLSWRPGITYENVLPEDVAAFADGMGKQILTVVSVHKPGRYPTRVFYTRAWVNPEGVIFGKSKLHIATLEKFRRISAGFMVRHRGFSYTLRQAA